MNKEVFTREIVSIRKGHKEHSVLQALSKQKYEKLESHTLKTRIF